MGVDGLLEADCRHRRGAFVSQVRSGSSHSLHQATERIQRAGRAARRHLEYMGVNHGGGDV